MSKETKEELFVLFIVAFFMIDVVIWSNVFAINYKYTLEPVNIPICYIEPQNEIDYSIDVDTAVNLVNDLFQINYTLKFDDLKSIGLNGMAYLFVNSVIIDETLTGWEVLKTLSHELCHIKYYTGNETYTEYMAFVNLYESNNETLKNRAEWLAYEQCTLRNRKNTEYDCGFYIAKYLVERKAECLSFFKTKKTTLCGLFG